MSARYTYKNIFDLFEKTIIDTVKSLPQQYRDQLENVAITLEETPSFSDYLSIKVHPGHALIFGLYRGVPRDRRTAGYLAIPDKITIFMRPIMAVSRTVDELQSKIRKTVLHEIGHHFGLSDSQLPR